MTRGVQYSTSPSVVGHTAESQRRIHFRLCNVTRMTDSDDIVHIVLLMSTISSSLLHLCVIQIGFPVYMIHIVSARLQSIAGE